MPAMLREDLFNKFKGVNIYVDSEIASPAKVWFLSSEEYPELDKSYEIVRADDTWGALVPDFKQYSSKWENAALAGHPEEKKDMCAIMSLLETMADCLIWKRESKSWVSDEREDKYTQKLQEIQDKNIQVVFFFHNHLLMGILNRMTNAVGRRAVEAVLTAAAIVAANGVRANRAVAYPVGSSRAVSESFPVDIIHSRRRSFQMEYDLRSQDENPNYESDSNVSGSWKEGELYSDVILACNHHPNFPHFLFLAEIKSEVKISQRHEAQLLRQMLAGIMHQTVVFGLLIGSTEASIFVMKHNFERKKIHTAGCQYNFRPDPTSEKFPIENIKKLFIDIVAAIEYCSQNVKEIYHGF